MSTTTDSPTVALEVPLSDWELRAVANVAAARRARLDETLRDLLLRGCADAERDRRRVTGSGAAIAAGRGR